jgi:hypothetical protein
MRTIVALAEAHGGYDRVHGKVETHTPGRGARYIKELRARQPVISKIDVKLLVEVAGIDLDLAKFLCTEFLTYRQPPVSWTVGATQTAQLFARGVHSLWDQWSFKKFS